MAGLLASNQPGEVINAAAMATAILRKHRLAWAEVIHVEGQPRVERPDDDLDVELIPRSSFPHDLLRRYIRAFIAERAAGAHDFDPSFLRFFVARWP